MNAETCVSYCDMTSMDSYYSASSAQARDQQTNPFRTFPTNDTKYSPTFLANKSQGYGEKSRSPFQPEYQPLDGTAGEGTFNKYHLFMQRSSCKTPPESSKLHQESAPNGGLICYGELKYLTLFKTKHNVLMYYVVINNHYMSLIVLCILMHYCNFK